MRDPVPPPADFVSFVAGHADRLHAAAALVRGPGPAAEALVIDLFAAAAARWARIRPRPDAPAGGRAADYVGELFRREAARHPPTRHPGPPSSAVRLSTARPPAPPTRPRPGRSRRRWSRSRPRPGPRGAAPGSAGHWSGRAPSGWWWPPCWSAPAHRSPSPTTRPVRSGRRHPRPPRRAPETVPAGLDVLPRPDRLEGLPEARSRLPRRISLTKTVGTLRSHPIPYALAAFRPPEGPLLLLGPDGRLRSVPEPTDTRALAPSGPPVDSRQIRLTSTGLSADGTAVAQLAPDGLTVLRVPTGKLLRFPIDERLRWVTWLDPWRLLTGGLTSSVLVELTPGRLLPTTLAARTTLTPRAGAIRPVDAVPPVPPTSASLLLPSGATTPPETAQAAGRHSLPGAVELLPVGEPATAPARLRRHVATPDGVRPLDTAVSGELAGWLGPWRGGGFLTQEVALRDFVPVGQLPARYGTAALATAAIDAASGAVIRLLVAATEQAGPPQLLGASGPGFALIRAAGPDGVTYVIGWRVTTGALYLVATIDTDASVALTDLATCLVPLRY